MPAPGSASGAYSVGDLVWARVKGFPVWPGQVRPAQAQRCRSLLLHLSARPPVADKAGLCR